MEEMEGGLLKGVMEIFMLGNGRIKYRDTRSKIVKKKDEIVREVLNRCCKEPRRSLFEQRRLTSMSCDSFKPRRTVRISDTLVQPQSLF
ncbi:unnamed protein product [Leptidea sinapis]|uniref:Uncharacterized protein n=1 Tax=Leptidea sinapis TaxID=189913 RepID=A0A5E4QJ58_9NEOP|nr:unnamed protein product [Leptidea sinapis]